MFHHPSVHVDLYLAWAGLAEEKRRLEQALIVASGICQSALRKMEPGFSQSAWWEGGR